MKVLHLIQKPQLRGAEVFTSQLATHVNQSGNSAVVVSIFPGSAALPFKGTMYNLQGKAKHRHWDIKAWRKLATIIKKEQPDIIQANAGDTLMYAVFSKLFFRWQQPILFRNASTISLYIKTAMAKKWHSLFFGRAAKVISVSHASATDFATVFPQYANKIVTIPIGIEQFQVTDKEMGHQKKAPVLVHVGGFTHEKNHLGLLRIFELVLKQLPAAKLHLVGDGPLKNIIQAEVQQRGLDKQVTFYGFQKNAVQFMKDADVLLLPSNIEGLPGVILEAFFCRTPVVAYNVGGIKEIVLPDETGRLVTKGAEEAFANSVIEALQVTEHNKKMIENAYTLVTTHYLNTAIAQKFLHTYEAVLQ